MLLPYTGIRLPVNVKLAPPYTGTNRQGEGQRGVRNILEFSARTYHGIKA
jgi:hypothetical protein